MPHRKFSAANPIVPNGSGPWIRCFPNLTVGNSEVGDSSDSLLGPRPGRGARVTFPAHPGVKSLSDEPYDFSIRQKRLLL